MITLLSAVFVASLLGSVHCAGMCGPLVAFAVGGGAGGRQTRLQLTYQLGRLGGYLVLGAAAGAAGALVNLASTLAGLQPVAMTAAGVTMITAGAIELARLRGARIGGVRAPAWLLAPLTTARRAAIALTPTARALTIGLLTALLPCGWLYVFAVTAAGTGSPLHGAAVMGVFWLGAVPVLASVGLGVQTLTRVLGARAPALTCVALIGLGAVALIGRGSLSAESLAAAAEASAPRANAGRLSKAPSANELPPCCRPPEGGQAP